MFTDNHGLFHLPRIRYIQKFEQLHPDILCLVFLRFLERNPTHGSTTRNLIFVILRKLSKKDSNKAGLGKASMQQLFKLTTDKKKLRQMIFTTSIPLPLSREDYQVSCVVCIGKS